MIFFVFALPLISSLLTGLVEFLRPFLLNAARVILDKIFVGSQAFLAVLYAKFALFLSNLPFFVAWSTAFYLLLLALTTFLSFLIDGLLPAIPESVRIATGWFLPSNTFECLSVVYSSKIYRFIYDHKQIVLAERKRSMS